MKKKLKEICEVKQSKTTSLDDDKVWILNLDKIESHTGKILEYEYSKRTELGQSICQFDENTVLYSKLRPYLNKVVLPTEKGFATSELVPLVPKENITRKYLAAFLRSNHFVSLITDKVAGTKMPRVVMKDFFEVEIPVPTLSEQQKIAAELDKIQTAIDNKKQQLSLLDEAVKSKFVEMFDSIIEKSEKIDLEKICTFVTVGIANSATHAFCDDGIIMFRNQNIKEDFLDDSDVIYIKQDFAEKYKSKALKENDLLIVRTGYPGICCLVPKEYEGCQTFTTLIARLKKNSDINPKFICHYINSKYGREYVEKNQAGVAQQNFGATALSKMPMVIPPINLQNNFAAFVQQIDKSKSLVKQQIADLQELLDSKMQQYFA